MLHCFSEQMSQAETQAGSAFQRIIQDKSACVMIARVRFQRRSKNARLRCVFVHFLAIFR